MSESQHTPGPWKVCDICDNPKSIRAPALGMDNHIASVFEPHDTNGKANAHLIAAAPEMFLVIEKLFSTGRDKHDGAPLAVFLPLKELGEIIAKVKGDL